MQFIVDIFESKIDMNSLLKTMTCSFFKALLLNNTILEYYQRSWYIYVFAFIVQVGLSCSTIGISFLNDKEYKYIKIAIVPFIIIMIQTFINNINDKLFKSKQDQMIEIFRENNLELKTEQNKHKNEIINHTNMINNLKKENQEMKNKNETQNQTYEQKFDQIIKENQEIKNENQEMKKRLDYHERNIFY